MKSLNSYKYYYDICFDNLNSYICLPNITLKIKVNTNEINLLFIKTNSNTFPLVWSGGEQ